MGTGTIPIPSIIMALSFGCQWHEMDVIYVTRECMVMVGLGMIVSPFPGSDRWVVDEDNGT